MKPIEQLSYFMIGIGLIFVSLAVIRLNKHVDALEHPSTWRDSAGNEGIVVNDMMYMSMGKIKANFTTIKPPEE